MSAIWGNIEFGKDFSSVSSMADEYYRKCKLDRVREIHFKNAVIGAGIQHINIEDEYEEMPYILKDRQTIIVADAFLDDREQLYKEIYPEDNLGTDIERIPDCKMICMSFEKWGYDFVKHLRGIFSIAIYDALNEKLFICTDRTSSRCLYYYKTDSTITFSTLISPIKKLFSDITVNEMYMKDFLLIPGLLPNISSEETPWNDIYVIEPGCSVAITKNDVVKNRYYSPQKKELPRDIDKLKEIFLSTYHTAVKRATRTNKDVAIALSGGFDSSSVAAMASPILQEAGKKLYSYTYVPHYDMSSYYPENQITDETKLVKEMAFMYPNIKTTFTDNDGRGCFDYIDELIDIMEIPFKAFVNLPLLLEIYKSAGERGCKVFLNGQTGNSTVSFGKIDEAIYYLYSKKHYLKAFDYFNNFCKAAELKRNDAFSEEIHRIKSQKSKKTMQTEYEADDINMFVNAELLDEYSMASRNKCGMPYVKDPHVLTSDKMQYEVYTLPALSYIGAMETKLGLYTGVIIRDATRDSDIIDFALSFPFEYYSYKGIPRYLIRGFMEDLLPREILYPIEKKGIQSADWIFRLSDSKDKVLDSISETIKKSFDGKYLDNNTVEEFLKERKDFNLDNENEYLNLFITFIYGKYKLLQL